MSGTQAKGMQTDTCYMQCYILPPPPVRLYLSITKKRLRNSAQDTSLTAARSTQRVACSIVHAARTHAPRALECSSK